MPQDENTPQLGPRYGTVVPVNDVNQNGKRPGAALEWAPRKKS